MASDAVASGVKRTLKLKRSVSEILGDVTTVNSSGSLTVDITYTAGSQHKADAGADAFGAVFLAQRKALADGLVVTARARLTAAVSPLQVQLAAANNVLAQADPTTGQSVAARAQADQLSAEVTSLTSQVNSLTTIDTTPGQLVRSAAGTSHTAGVPDIALEAGIVAVAALAGLGLALARDRLDPRVATRGDIDRLSPGTSVDVLPRRSSSLAEPLRGSPRRAALDRLGFRLAPEGDTGTRCIVLAGTGDRAPIAFGSELHRSLSSAGLTCVLVSTVPESAIGRADPGLERRSLDAVVTGGSSLKRLLGQDTLGVLLCPDDDAEAAAITTRNGLQRLLARADGEGFDAVVFVAPTPVRHAGTVVLARESTAVVVAAGPRSSRSGVRNTLNAFLDADLFPFAVVIG